MSIAAETCESCNKEATLLTQDEIAGLKSEVPEWEVVSIDGEQQLRRQFDFDDFVSALAFTQALGGIAEEVQHHPAILTEYGSCTVRWWTHKIGGLHRNDFIMAARTDERYQEAPAST